MDEQDYTIGIISDTHGLLRPGVSTVFQDVDLIIHAGDIGSQSVLNELKSMSTVVAVRGNMDHEAWARGLPLTEVAEIGKSLVYVLHDVSRLDLEPSSSGFLAVINGHTHRPLIKKQNGVLYVNPGNSGPGSSNPTVALMHIKDGTLSARVETI
ncbi:MAG TPA: metallophosphoesterase [Nitrospirae bacterium]|nr:phosphodiesterase [bacterium BMS3Abin10]GBE39310.1 phosphodiesterase [bacterium BMS3Bbin08]HDH50115.1 metallophosphoesterase [Nitrospirota bacterium]HDK81911.1 metallophosphoesterase [Nitrospirota bacterium]HDO25105.1 metallophosphoesterase [Nitrospirota bacterium]